MKHIHGNRCVRIRITDALSIEDSSKRNILERNYPKNSREKKQKHAQIATKSFKQITNRVRRKWDSTKAIPNSKRDANGTTSSRNLTKNRTLEQAIAKPSNTAYTLK